MSQYFAVVGNPVAHSLSPVIHQQFAKQLNIQLRYEKIITENKYFALKIKDFFAHGGKGLNITSPFKQWAFMLAQQPSERCKRAGAANTLWMDNQQLHADNTDGIGLVHDLKNYIALSGKRVLILGAGGAARGIIEPLVQQKISQLMVANRTLSNVIELQKIFPKIQGVDLDGIEGHFDLIINATSASLSGAPVALPTECLSSQTFCYDLAYTLHGSTAFIQQVRSFNCQAVDGLGMLVEQAAESFFIWHKMRPDTQSVLNFLRKKL